MNRFPFLRHLTVVILTIGLCSSASVSDDNRIYPTRKNESFKRGEVLKFKMSYGWMGIGEGEVKVHDNFYKANERPSYRVQINGWTTGFLNFFIDIKDEFGADIDTASLLPHTFYRIVREGSYAKDEWTFFDHEDREIEVRTWGKDKKMRDPKFYEMAEDTSVWDMVSSFLYFRTFDFSKATPGDTISLHVFFEDEFYNLNVVYKGKDKVKVKAGTFNAIKLKPVMPKNKMFKGENSITAWFTDDKNRIPLKIEAEMFIGSAGVELTGYSGLRNPVSKIK